MRTDDWLLRQVTHTTPICAASHAHLLHEARGVRHVEADGRLGALDVGVVVAGGEDPVGVLLAVRDLRGRKGDFGQAGEVVGGSREGGLRGCLPLPGEGPLTWSLTPSA